MDILKVTALGLTGAVLSLMLKRETPAISIFIGIITGVMLFMFISDKLIFAMGVLKDMSDRVGLNDTYFDIVLKVVGIAYVSEFGVRLCSDAGESSIASKIELSGKIIIMVVSAPVFMALLDIVSGI